MPFELIVQSAFTERLDGGAVCVRKAGDHVTDPDQIAALKGNPHLVQVWIDDPEPEAEPVLEPIAPAPVKVAFPVTDPALKPASA